MKFIFSLLVAVIVGFLSCSAADFDSVDYYSLDPVQSLSPTVNSALDYAVQPLSATSWDTSDQTNLNQIRNAFYNPNSGYVSNSIIGWVKKLADNSVSLTGLIDDVSELCLKTVGNVDGSIYYNVRDIHSALVNTPTVVSGSLVDNVRKIYLSASNTSRVSDELLEAIDGPTGSVNDYLGAIWGWDLYIKAIESGVAHIKYNTDYIWSSLSSFFASDMSYDVGYFDSDGNYVYDFTLSPRSFKFLSGLAFWNLSTDRVMGYTEERTLYGLIHQLQQVLASDDDLALANSQKANREEIESTFLTGSSGSTSLGASDFGDLADVGGTIKDSLSLDGNATIGSFTSGLAAADSAGQGWFSEVTRSQLDAVSSTVTYSLRDPDPYNMSGWEDRYYWLLGDDE